MNKTFLSVTITSLLATAAASPVYAQTENQQATDEESIERILVVGDFRARGIEDVAASVTVLQQEDIRQRQAEHLEHALAMAPNVNLASGASRATFFQIRGVGERSQFVDPINPSVGLVIDGINYSGLGIAAQTFDIGQVEVFRGPQSTRFGADGMAGMIYLSSEAPTEEFTGQAEFVVANYNTLSGGIGFGGRLADNVRARGSVQQYVSDGFMENIYLGRKDTQNHDELTARLNFDIDASEHWNVLLTYHFFNLNNGYDAWSLDLNRQTLSDTPGKDTLNSHAGRIASIYSGIEGQELQLMVSGIDSDSEYSFDEDWAYEGIRPGWEYNSRDAYFRDRDQFEIEGRWLSTDSITLAGTPTDWVAGAYHQERSQSLYRDYTYLPGPFSSEYKTQHQAVYGELQQQLTQNVRVSYGLRYEQYDNRYVDSRGITEQPKDSALGGRASLEMRLAPMEQVYLTFARGFKPGGVNGEALGRMEERNLEDFRDFLEQRSTFEPEYLTSLEAGYKVYVPQRSLALHMNVFYSWRDDMQANAYVERNAVFVTYRDNAAGGANYGAELQLDYVPTERLRLFASVGFLETELRQFYLQDGTDLTGRSQAHAPRYQFHFGGEYELAANLQLRLDVDGRDKFYFSNSHDEQSESYQLVHLRLNYNWQDWQFSVWARNLLDTDYETRGFYFGNDPRDEYTAKNYVQYGEPRRLGMTATYRF